MPNTHTISAIPALLSPGLLLILTGCFSGPSYMPPEEALKRAAASIDRTLQHAREDASAPVAHDPSQTPPDPSELLLWYPEHPILGPALAPEGPALTAFAKDNPNVRLQPQSIGPWHFAVQKLTVSLASGDMPDIAVVKRDLLPHLAEAGRIARLDTLLPQSLLDDLRPEVLRDHRIGDALYALPADGFCTVLFYSPSEVPTSPETWAALLDFAKSFDRSPRQGIDRRFALGDLPFLESLWSAGGDVYRDGHSALNEPAAIETMNFLWSLRNGGIASPGKFGRGDAAMSSFSTGRIAMTVASSAWLAQLQ
ncbi:MAG: extracellular solute-binding protein, partial [Candidatus Hydrogenedentales bacterium]